MVCISVIIYVTERSRSWLRDVRLREDCKIRSYSALSYFCVQYIIKISACSSKNCLKLKTLEPATRFKTGTFGFKIWCRKWAVAYNPLHSTAMPVKRSAAEVWMPMFKHRHGFFSRFSANEQQQTFSRFDKNYKISVLSATLLGIHCLFRIPIFGIWTKS